MVDASEIDTTMHCVFLVDVNRKLLYRSSFVHVLGKGFGGIYRARKDRWRTFRWCRFRMPRLVQGCGFAISAFRWIGVLVPFSANYSMKIVIVRQNIATQTWWFTFIHPSLRSSCLKEKERQAPGWKHCICWPYLSCTQPTSILYKRLVDNRLTMAFPPHRGVICTSRISALHRPLQLPELV